MRNGPPSAVPGHPKPAVASIPVHARGRLGALGEELAAAHFGRLGFRVLERNVRTRLGEIDLIAFDGRVLVFAEVKTARAATGAGRVEAVPLDWLRPRQRMRIRRLARAWLSDPERVRPRAAELRFDAVGVVVDARGRLLALEHLQDAW